MLHTYLCTPGTGRHQPAMFFEANDHIFQSGLLKSCGWQVFWVDEGLGSLRLSLHLAFTPWFGDGFDRQSLPGWCSFLGGFLQHVVLPRQEEGRSICCEVAF